MHTMMITGTEDTGSTAIQMANQLHIDEIALATTRNALSERSHQLKQARKDLAAKQHEVRSLEALVEELQTLVQAMTRYVGQCPRPADSMTAAFSHEHRDTGAKSKRAWTQEQREAKALQMREYWQRRREGSSSS